MLHFIEGERVGVDGRKTVDVDRCHDPSTRWPSGATRREGERAPLLLLPWPPPRWEEGFPSSPWLPWHGRGESPSEIGFVSLSSSVSRPPDLALHGFLNSRRSVTPIALKFLHDFFHKLFSCTRRRAPTNFQGGHKTPGCARECLARPSGL